MLIVAIVAAMTCWIVVLVLFLKFLFKTDAIKKKMDKINKDRYGSLK